MEVSPGGNGLSHVDDLKPDHKCSVIGCSRCIPQDHLMCMEHWFMVTTDTRKNIARLRDARDRSNCREYAEAVNDSLREVAEYQRDRPLWKSSNRGI
jgi:hypothetical protein